MENKRYVKLLPGWSTGDEFVGEIFDTEKDFQVQFKKFSGITKSWSWEYILSESNHSRHFEYVSEKDYWEQELDKNRLVKGGYYINSDQVVHKHSGTKNAEYYINWEEEVFNKNGGNFSIDLVEKGYFRLATDFEIAWLEACKETDEFITKEEFEKAYYTKKQKEMTKIKTVYHFKEGLWSDHLEKNKILKDIAYIGLIHDQMEDPDEREILKALENPYIREHFERLNVMDIWFTKQEIQVNPFKFGDWITFAPPGSVIPDCNSYTTRYEGVDKDGWVQSTVNRPPGGNYHFQYYRFATQEEIDSAESIIIKGHIVEVKEGYINIGCKTFKYSDVESVIKVIHAGLEVEHSDKIKKVWERLNK